MVKFAKPIKTWGECQRSGLRMYRKNMVRDGHIKGLLVHPKFYEPEHPQERRNVETDAIQVKDPAPELSIAGFIARYPTFIVSEARYTPDLILRLHLGEAGVSLS